MPFFVGLVFGGLGLVGVGLAGWAIVLHARLRAIDLNYLVLFAAVIVSNGTAAVSQFSGGRTMIATGPDSFVAVLSPAARQFSSFTLPLMAGLTLAVILIQIRRRVHLNGVAFAFLFLIALGGMSAMLAGGDFLNLGRLTLVLPVLALAVSKPTLGAMRGAAVGLALLVSFSGLLALVAPEQASAACDARKCGAFGGLFNGVAFNFNGLGLLLAIALPVLYFGLSKYRWYFVPFALVLCFASGSRTAQFAAVVTLLLVAIYELTSRWRMKPSAMLGALVCGVSAAVTAVLPFIGLDPGEFTGRVGLWDLALSELRQSWMFGLGPDSWASQVGDGVISYVSAYSTHNQMVEVLYISGVFGLLLFASILIAVIVRNRHGLAQVFILLAPALIVASTERPWTLGVADWLSWSILLFIALRFNATEGEPEANGMISARSAENKFPRARDQIRA